MNIKLRFIPFLAAIMLLPSTSFAQVIAAGGRHALAICADSTVRSWGYNGFGQLGNGTTMEQHTGVVVSGLTGVRQVAGGLFHSLFLKNYGTVFSAGRNQYGQLGDGTTVDKKTFIQLNSMSGIVQAEAGGIHSVFFKNDGTVWSCGLNSEGNNDGQLGDGTTVVHYKYSVN